MAFTGGQPVVDRLLQAYGFTTQRELVERIGVGHGTVSTWIRREYFPGEAVVQCALDTGVSLAWLATGSEDQGQMDIASSITNRLNLIEMPCKELIKGILVDKGKIRFDKSLLSNPFIEPELICSDTHKQSHIIEKNFPTSTDGEWLLEKAGVVSIESIKRIPGDYWRIETVDWPVKEVRLLGKVIYVIVSKA